MSTDNGATTDHSEAAGTAGAISVAVLPPSPAPVPADVPLFAWAAPDAPGAVLPPPLALPDRPTRLTVTPAWRRRRIARTAGTMALYAVGQVAVFYLATFGNLSLVQPVFWYYLLAMVTGVALASWRNPGALALTLGADEVVFEHSAYLLRASWAEVTGLVQLGRDPTALALRLERSAVHRERDARARPWRRVPYPWDRTILLAPFAAGDPELRALRLVAGGMPSLQGVPALVSVPPAESAGARIVGLGIVLVPVAAAVAAVNLALGDHWMTIATQVAIMCGLVGLGTLRWNGSTGERFLDFIARVGRGSPVTPRRALAPALGRLYSVYAIFYALGFALAISSSAPSAGRLPSSDPAVRDALTAKYGPAHACFENDQEKIVGCRLSDGSLMGSIAPTQVVCYFSEPLAADQQTFHCTR